MHKAWTKLASAWKRRARKSPQAPFAHLPAEGRLRWRTMGIVVAINLAVAAAIGLILQDNWRNTVSRARSDVENLNLLLKGEIEEHLSRIDFCLQRIAEAFADSKMARVEDLQPVVDREAARLHGVTGIRVANAEGDMVVVSNGRLSQKVNIGDAERFRVHRDNPNVGLYISGLEMGHVTNQWVFTLGRRLTRPDGGFGGEVHASVPLSEIEAMFSQLRLQPHGVVSLWNEVPTNLARYPKLKTPSELGKAPPSPKLQALIAAHTEAADYTAVSGTDRLSRIYFVRKLTDLPLYLIIGAADDDLRTEWLGHALQFGAIYALFALASIIGGAIFHARAVSRLAAESQLKLAALVYENSAEAMVVLDLYSTILGVNQAFVEITGWSRGFAVGRKLLDFPGGGHDPATLEAIGRELKTRGRWTGELPGQKASGEKFLGRASLSVIKDDPDGFRRAVLLFSDITEQKKTEEIVWRHANLDPLTLLPNRRMFRGRLEREIEKASASGAGLGVLFVDLDGFKEVNDSVGHQKGDELLRAAASRVVECVGKNDLVARLGGDEFTVLLPDLGELDALERSAQKIVEALAAPYQLGDEACFVTASVGITAYPKDAQDADGLLRAADLAMYAAKSNGRNRLEFFKPSLLTASTERAELVRRLHRALEDRQFELHYQPIVSLATGTVEMAEALIRWRHPTRGLISPADFIPVAEETGLICDIGDWVFEEVARQIASWKREFGTAPSISVNVSPVQFSATPGRILALPELLARHRLMGRDIVLEITEGVLLGASEETRRLISGLSECGIRLALDDFGTGYSSLAYLKQFEIGALKIDKGFVRGLGVGANDLAICEAIIAMARRLGIAVVAEGIETETQRELLAAARCEFGQGYLFAKPMSPDNFAAACLNGKEQSSPSDAAAA